MFPPIIELPQEFPLNVGMMRVIHTNGMISYDEYIKAVFSVLWHPFWTINLPVPTILNSLGV